MQNRLPLALLLLPLVACKPEGETTTPEAESPASTEPAQDAQTVEVVVLEPQSALVIRTEAAPEEIGARLGELLPRVAAHLAETGVEQEGAPFTRYLNREPPLQFEAGIPVGVGGQSKDDITAIVLPGGEVAMIRYFGPYEGLTAAYEALEAWVASSGREPSGPPWESYVTDPGAEPDPNKWETRVYLPLVTVDE